jgi:tight adherence protein B
MSPLVLGLVVVSLLSATVLGLVAFAQSRSGDKLRSRVRAAGGIAGAAGAGGAGAASVVGGLPSIRREVRSARPWLTRLQRAVCYDPEVPKAYAFPWWAVAGVGAVIGLAIGLRLEVLLGLVEGLLAGAAIGFLLVRAVFNYQFSGYRDAMFKQIPDAIGQMVRTVRAGLPMAEALRSVSREMPAPSSEEFARVVGDVAIGRPLDQALLRLADRTRLTESAFLAVTLGLQSRTGGSLAETLENLAETVRKRVSIANRAQALAAEAKMQAGMLAVLPFIAAPAMSVIQPFYIDTFTQNPTGRKMAVIGLCLLAVGLLAIRHLIRSAGRD